MTQDWRAAASLMRVALPALAIILAALASAHAGGECVKGFRDTTTEERSAMLAVIDVAKRAIPAAPEGWMTSGDETPRIVQTICGDQDADPWGYDFMRYYQRVDDADARNQAFQAAAAEMAASMEAKQPRLNALTTKMNAMSQELAAAAQAQDYARTEAIGKEIEKLSAEYQKIVEEGGTTEKMNAASDAVNRDREMRVMVEVNPGFESTGSAPDEIAPPAGATHALRWREKRGGNEEANALVLLGSWERIDGGGFKATPQAGASAAAAHAMSVRFVADPSRIDAMLAATDFAALSATLAK